MNQEIKNHTQNQFYGLKNGDLRHISDVENGLKCDCICPACNEKLVAKNSGTKRINHFSHYTNKVCKYGAQTSLHLAAKNILEKVKRIKVPRVEIFINKGIEKGRNEFISKGEFIEISNDFYIPIENVILEKKLHTYIPDVVILSKGKKLIVEIAVTHFVGREKLKMIKDSKISAIEINLSHLKNDFNINQLEKLIIEDLNNKSWLHNEFAEKQTDSYRKEI